MNIKILAFGSTSDIVKDSDLQVPENSTISTLRNYLVQIYPGLENLKFQISVNKKVASVDLVLNQNDEIALLPPFSGG